LIPFAYDPFEFEFYPDGSFTGGELEATKGKSEPYGAKVDLASSRSRSEWAKKAHELYSDVFEDVTELERGLTRLYAHVKEKERIDEAKKAEERDEEETPTATEEEIAELLSTGVLERYVEDMADAGAVHEDRPYLKTVTLGGLSAQLELSGNRPLGTNIILTGSSGRGKNYVPDAAAQGMPDEFVYAFESASAKSFYYQADAQPDRFRHTWVYPNEAEATDQLVDTLRPLLSKGSADHGTVDSAEDGANAFRSLHVQGPVTVTIPTVRNKLDGQLQTRFLTVELEDYKGRVAGHTEKFTETLLPDYVAVDHAGTLQRWKTALKTLTAVRRVVLPGKVEGFRYNNDNVSHGARLWRNLLSFMLTHAWLEQRNREIRTLSNNVKAVVARAEDYRVAYELFKAVAQRSVVNLGEAHIKICDALYELQKDGSGRLQGRGFSTRDIGKKARISYQTVQKHKTFLITSEGLLRESEKGGLMLVEGAEPTWWHESNLLNGLPTPEQVEEWWHALPKPVDTVDSDALEGEKPIDKSYSLSTPTVDTSVDTSTVLSTPTGDAEKPIDKPKKGKKDEVSTLSTGSEDAEETEEAEGFRVNDEGEGGTELGSYRYS